MNNLHKHKILKALYGHWDTGERNSRYGMFVTPLGRSLSIIDLNRVTGIKTDVIQRLCFSLVKDETVQLFQEDKNNKAHLYLITDAGKSAYIDKLYRNRFWLYNFDFWKWAMGFVIAVGGLVFVYLRWVAGR